MNGGSAGANNCAEFAVHYQDEDLCKAIGATPEEIRPAAAVLAYGVYDYVLMQKTLEKIGDQDRIEMNRGFNLAAFGDPDALFGTHLGSWKHISFTFEDAQCCRSGSCLYRRQAPRRKY